MNAFALPEAAPVRSRLGAFYDLIEDIAADPSKSGKEARVAAALAAPHGESHTELLNFALSPYITFGVKQLPAPASGVSMEFRETMRHSFSLALLRQLASRDLSGGAAQTAIANCLALLDGDERTALSRILLKDLRAGFSAKTVNKARRGTIPVFACQLAPSAMASPDSLTYPLAVEPKYDGVRTIAVRKAGVVTLFSRNGKPFENFEEVESAVAEMPAGLGDFVLDGEVVSGLDINTEEGFKRVMKRAKASRGVGIEGNPVAFQVFDGMSLSEWESQSCGVFYSDRRDSIAYKLSQTSSRTLRLSPYRVCASQQELTAYYAELTAQGFEGVMIKPLEGLYTFARNKQWLKLKPFETVDLTVTGFAEGTGKYEGMLGALLCEGYDGERFISAHVGSGFTDAQRAEFITALRNDTYASLDDSDRIRVLGQIAEIRYQDVTRAEGSESYSLRFPTFIRFRSDNTGRKI